MSFVGSTPIARHVYETAASTGKRVQALGGAKNHMVVLPDADLDQAADAAVSAGYGSAGERCMAISVVVAVDPVGDELVDEIHATPCGGCSIADGATRVPTWARSSPPACTATGVHGPDVAGAAEGATLVVDGRALRSTDRPTGSCWAMPVRSRDPPTWPSTGTRSSVRCSRSCGRRPTTKRRRLVTENPYGNGVAPLHP